jgi:hypothetical protein
MMKREIYMPILLIFLFIAFLMASGMVLFIKAKPGWIKAKLKIGALILSLTAVASCGSPQVSCYEMPPVKDSGRININDTIKKDTVLPKLKKDTIKFHKP